MWRILKKLLIKLLVLQNEEMEENMDVDDKQGDSERLSTHDVGMHAHNKASFDGLKHHHLVKMLHRFHVLCQIVQTIWILERGTKGQPHQIENMNHFRKGGFPRQK